MSIGFRPVRSSFAETGLLRPPTPHRTAGINDIPVELLGEIFLICKANHNLEHYPFTTVVGKNSLAPVLLTHVCQLWRTICFALPTLWASFSLYRFSAPDVVFHHQVTLWLRRSHDTPLKLDMSQHSRQGPLPQNVISSVISHSHRWRVLSISARDGGFINDFLALPASATPALEGLHIWHGSFQQIEPQIPALVSKIQSLPSLRELLIGIYSLPSRPYRELLAGIPFERLTHLRLQLGCMTLEDCVYFLGRCTSAVELCFTTVGIHYPPPGQNQKNQTTNISDTKTTLPHLRSLSILTKSVPIARIIGPFVCPSLQRLSIHDFHSLTRVVPEENYSAIDTFLHNCHLEQLIIYDVQGTWESVKKYLSLKSLQAIRDVEIRVMEPAQHQGPLTADGYHCPMVNCRVPHLGWSSNSSLHLGIPRPVVDWKEGSYTTDLYDSLHARWAETARFGGFEDVMRE